MAKIIIVSNRLPVKIEREGEDLVYKTSAGGLATGLSSIYKEGNNIWIGWPGIHTNETTQSGVQEVIDRLRKENMVPVFLSEDEVLGFYEGFSNGTLWPLFHYFAQYALYDHNLWEQYVAVSKKYAAIIVEHAAADDTIWIHDYQLLLVPAFVREQLPEASIGFFQHIPFPSYEVFRLLPWRKELLEGVLGADLIGFHTYDDIRHFLSSVNRILGYANTYGLITLKDRLVQVDSFPMGIDYDKYAQVAKEEATEEKMREMREGLGSVQLILTIDRLDYSKGIPSRLEAFRIFLRGYPQYLGKVSLLMIVVPSRDKVGKYQELKVEVDELVGNINSEFSQIGWTPIQYFYRSFSLTDLSALYRLADVALVTPMRDGMNLVCKEFIASRIDQSGVLILSEMAGASKELSDAILINPNHVNKMAEAIQQALEMPREDQRKHIAVMQNSIKRYNIYHWVDLFMNHLNDIKKKQYSMKTKKLDEKIRSELTTDYRNAKKRLLLLDYDGTLMPFTADPEKTIPDEWILQTLEALSKNKNNTLTIISGRSHEALEQWLGHLPLGIIAEHGVWLKHNGKAWEKIREMDDRWKQDIKPIMDSYVARTPGSFIEEKDYSLVWHYRKVETGLGELRTRELAAHLRFLTGDFQLQVLEGDMVVEVKSVFVNKGTAASIWLEEYPADFILAIGDDWTDEDTFKTMPTHAYTIKVGAVGSEARYRVPSVEDVRKLLNDLRNE